MLVRCPDQRYGAIRRDRSQPTIGVAKRPLISRPAVGNWRAGSRALLNHPRQSTRTGQVPGPPAATDAHLPDARPTPCSVCFTSEVVEAGSAALGAADPASVVPVTAVADPAAASVPPAARLWALRSAEASSLPERARVARPAAAV